MIKIIVCIVDARWKMQEGKAQHKKLEKNTLVRWRQGEVEFFPFLCRRSFCLLVSGKASERSFSHQFEFKSFFFIPSSLVVSSAIVSVYLNFFNMRKLKKM